MLSTYLKDVAVMIGQYKVFFYLCIWAMVTVYHTFPASQNMTKVQVNDSKQSMQNQDPLMHVFIRWI